MKYLKGCFAAIIVQMDVFIGIQEIRTVMEGSIVIIIIVTIILVKGKDVFRLKENKYSICLNTYLFFACKVEV